eukprot:COSAG01_NODE_64785_length_275_cov_0.846591_1_plen_22_part_10
MQAGVRAPAVLCANACGLFSQA